MTTSRFISTGVRFLAGSLLATAAMADKGSMMPAKASPAYQQECAACHMAYPPALLPPASWQRIMGTLGQHYGTDASLDSAAVRDIGQWLQANAGTYKRVSEAPPRDRITESAWFLRKHNAHEVPPAVWKRASVRSPSNCTACHTQAAQGIFDERQIRIPQ